MKKNILIPPRVRGEKRIAKLREKIVRSIKKLPFDDQNRQNIEALMGIKGHSSLLLASDLEARSMIADQLVKLMLDHRSVNTKNNYYHLTLIDDAGSISDRAPVLDIKAIQNKAHRALRRLGLHGIVVVEAHPLANHPQGGAGRTILFHAHIFAWSEVSLNIAEAEAELVKGGGWRNSFGAKPGKIQRVRSNDEDFERLARYITKPPHCAKNLKPRKGQTTQFRLMKTFKGYRPEFALRTMEIFSQVELIDLVSSVGTGTKVRQDLRTCMNTWHRERVNPAPPLPGDFDIWRFWYDLRRDFGSKQFLPVRIQSGGYRMRPVNIARPRSVRRSRRPRPIRGRRQRSIDRARARRKVGHT